MFARRPFADSTIHAESKACLETTLDDHRRCWVPGVWLGAFVVERTRATLKNHGELLI